MSGDLISRSALLQTLKYTKAITEDENGETRQLIAIDINKVIEYVEKMPTAYNVDKVVEQLEEYSSGDVCSRFSGGCPYLNNPDVHCEHCAVMMAIEIVKAGGVE